MLADPAAHLRRMNRDTPFALLVVFAFLVVFGVHSLDFPGSVPDFQRASGGGVLLDVKPSFSVEATYARLSAYGEAGRDNYAFRNRSVDILLPIAVFPALFLLMYRALNRTSMSRNSKWLLYSLPFLYLVFDFAENAAVLALLAQFPERMPLLAETLPWLTVVKRIASLLALAIPLAIFAVAAIRKHLR